MVPEGSQFLNYGFQIGAQRVDWYSTGDLSVCGRARAYKDGRLCKNVEFGSKQFQWGSESEFQLCRLSLITRGPKVAWQEIIV